MKRVNLRRWAIGVTAVVAALAAAAFYLLWAPKPGLPAGRAELVTVEFDGRTRRYSIVAPSPVAPGAAALLVFHRSQSSGEEMRRMAGHAIERIVAGANAVVVYPDGFEGHFNDCRRVASYSARTLAIDDVGFSSHIVDLLVTERQIDPARVYAIGYSNGGHMALRLALERPDLVRGVAAIGANLPAPDNLDCAMPPATARVVVFVAGTEDPINPYDGGPVTLFGFGNRGNVLSAESSAQWFAERLGAAAVGAETDVGRASGLTARRQDWIAHDGQMRLVTIEGGGHTIPQSDYRFPRIFGKTLQDDAILESTWRLFVADD